MCTGSQAKGHLYARILRNFHYVDLKRQHREVELTRVNEIKEALEVCFFNK